MSEIYQFMADRQRDDRSKELWLEGEGAQTEEEVRIRFRRHNEYTDRHFTETMSRYRERFQGRVMGLYADLRAAGLVSPEEHEEYGHSFEIPINTHSINQVANRLAIIGHQR